MKAWKKFEKNVADAIGGHRFWANSGEKVDVESAGFVGQCKKVKTLSLSALTKLVEQAEADARERKKIGFVAVKLASGRGKETPTLIVQQLATWRKSVGLGGADVEEGT